MSGSGSDQSSDHSSGHSVIAVAVPGLDAAVRERTARQDASFLPADPGFGSAHVTLLGPWLPRPTESELDAVAEVLAGTEPFDVVLAQVAEFADGTLHLLPEPAAPFRELTDRLAARFPRTPPYGGRHPDLVPHLTIDHRATGASVTTVAEDLAGLLPHRSRVDTVQLQWWANHDCHVRHRWRLGRHDERAGSAR